MTWRLQAACLGLDGDIFFPGQGQTGREAKQICAECSVIQPCLDYAISTGSHDGVWGGLTDKERIRYARKRRRTA